MSTLLDLDTLIANKIADAAEQPGELQDLLACLVAGLGLAVAVCSRWQRPHRERPLRADQHQHLRGGSFAGAARRHGAGAGMTVRILIGDVRERLRGLPDAYFDSVVTSPPYWGLRDYGVAGQIGLERTLGEHIAVMVDVFREVRRVLKPRGTLWLNYRRLLCGLAERARGADVVGDDRTFRDKPFSTVGPVFDPAYAARCASARRTTGATDPATTAGGWWLAAT